MEPELGLRLIDQNKTLLYDYHPANVDIRQLNYSFVLVNIELN
jgi:hypothetical protein